MGLQWDLAPLPLIAALVIVLAQVVRRRGDGHGISPVLAGVTSPFDLHRAGRWPAAVFCIVCEMPMAGDCARCGGPACEACDHCFGCRQRVCFACDLEPTPPFWLPGDRAPHPHNGALDA
jgi:hypothetical protein